MEHNRDPLTAEVIGAAIEVHRTLGPGLFEAVYGECLSWELEQRGLAVSRQVQIPVVYKGVRLDAAYRLDLLVEQKLVVEVKAVERLLPVHEAQVLTYMKMSRSSVGLLLNFNAPVLRDGIKRFVNRLDRGGAELSEASLDGATEAQGRRGCAETARQG